MTENLPNLSSDSTAFDGIAETETATAAIALDPKLLEQVEVSSQKLQGRQRQVSARIQIPQPIEQVWQILTAYDQLSEFIPNLAKSRRLPNTGEQTLIEQVGAQCWLNLKFCARVVLRMEEQFPQEIRFEMVEGDFKGFDGAWRLIPTTVNGQAGTTLDYTVNILPKLTMPVTLIERHLRHNLAVNLVAVQQRAIALG